ncbi:hypothetical protein Tco_0761344 [Tanacetum coccineum]
MCIHTHYQHGSVYNWKTALMLSIVFDDTFTSRVALSCERTVSSLDDDKIDFRISFDESEDEDYTTALKILRMNFQFPTIVYNDALTSKSDFLTEPAASPQHIDESNLKDETSLSEYDEEEQNILYFNDLFPFNVIYLDDLKSNKDNDDKPLGDVSVLPLPNEINTDVGAYVQGSSKLLKTSHDTSRKFFKTEIFVEELNITTWNHIHKGKPLIFIIKNLYVPFGIPFDPKRFYKDGV